MKRTILSLILIASASLAFAQEGLNKNESKAKALTERVSKKLELKATQKEKLEAIHLSEIKAQEELRIATRAEMKEKRAAMEANREALKANREEEAKQRNAIEAKRLELKSKSELIEKEHRAKVKSILTEEQYEEYLLLKGAQQGKKAAMKKYPTQQKAIVGKDVTPQSLKSMED